MGTGAVWENPTRRLPVLNPRWAMYQPPQTELTPTYKPMDCFQNGLEGKQHSEQADLWKVFPKKFHSEFHRNLIYQHPPEFAYILVLESSATTLKSWHKQVGGLTTAGNLLGGCNLPIRILFTIHSLQSSTGIIK